MTKSKEELKINSDVSFLNFLWEILTFEGTWLFVAFPTTILFGILIMIGG